MNKSLIIFLLLALIFCESHGSIRSSNKKIKIKCIDMLLKYCELSTNFELKEYKNEKLIEILDTNNVEENNKLNRLFGKKIRNPLERLRIYFRYCKDYEKETDESKKEILRKYLKKNNLTLLAGSSSEFTKMEILKRIENLFTVTGILPITIYFQENIMGKKEVIWLEYLSYASYLIIKDLNKIYTQLGGSETRGENMKKIARDYDQLRSHIIKNSTDEQILYVNASGTLKITNLTQLIENLAKDANMILSKNTHITIQKSFIENFNKFTEKFSNSIEDLIDLHNFFVIITVHKLNLLLKDVKLEKELFNGYSHLDSNDIQRKCLNNLLSVNDRILDPLFLIKLNNKTINTFKTIAKDMLKQKQWLKNMLFIDTKADLKLTSLDSIQFPEAFYKLGKDHIKNSVMLTKLKRYEGFYSAPNIWFELFLNHHYSDLVETNEQNNIIFIIEIAITMLNDLILYPNCNEAKKSDDVRDYSRITNALNLAYLFESTQDIDPNKVWLEPSKAKILIEHFCKKNTIIPFNIEAKKIIEVLSASFAVAKKYKCIKSSMNLNNCERPNQAELYSQRARVL
ncbi:uncharacterized protein LOC135923354 isoform X2 [Gordionus sp. m RMFG-2023]|uniref:uncharacterized protein LOC135923354 isoform X2 n=1 Tax=Gordionus sp. m RMFG-2023 TaxID=3053472 RepID=UPI0031FE36C1